MSSPTLPLMRAVAEGDAQTLKTLLAQGGDVNCRNQSGQTPLMMAALLGHAAIVPVLLESGADVRLRDNQGLSALEWSQRRGFADITELLMKALPVEPTWEEKETLSEDEFRARTVSDLGPAATAMLKAAHAKREAENARLKDEYAKQKPEPEQDLLETIAPPPSSPPPELQWTTAERERLFREAARKRIEDEVRLNTGQTLEEKFPQPPGDAPEPIAIAEQPRNELPESPPPVTPAVESAAPKAIESPPPPVAAAPTAEPPFDMYATQPVSAAAAAASREPAIGKTHPLASTGEKTFASSPAKATASPLPPRPTTPLKYGPTVEPIDSLPDAAGKELSAPTAESKAVDPGQVTMKLAASTLFSAAEPARPRSDHLFTRPVIWVLVALLLASAFVTYLVTNQLAKRDRLARAAASAPVTPAPPPPAPIKPGPFVAGPISGAQLNVPEAEYPAKAQSEGTKGAVTVLVRVNGRAGNVISAQALNGQRALKDAAEKAARAAKFSPDKLPHAEKIVPGTITYSFGLTNTASPARTSDDAPVVGGALAGTEESVPRADYPEAARAKGTSGLVMVLVRVNRMGEVIAARPLNGDGPLRNAAGTAAKKAKFSRDKLPRESLVTAGTITYNFTPTSTPSASKPSLVPNTAAPPSATSTEASNDNPVVTGDLAGKELNVPKPDYPEQARRKGISGKVEMLVRVNRQGRVISWRTLSGDALLRRAALNAAKKATFSPQKLGNIESVLGTITYTFKL